MRKIYFGFDNYLLVHSVLDQQWKQWIKLIKRTTSRNTNWKPGQSDMVCSKHFVDGIPTNENPFPTMNMGYEKTPICSRHKLMQMNITADFIYSENELLDEMECVGNQLPMTTVTLYQEILVMLNCFIGTYKRRNEQRKQ